MKFVQKHLIKGSRTYEIAGDLLQVHVKTPFRQEKTTVVLSVLNPEPVVKGPWLEFLSRVNGEPLVSLYLNKPERASFERFVGALAQRARDEYRAFTGLRAGSGAAAHGDYNEPPDFGAPQKPRLDKSGKPADVASIEVSIRMLRQHLDSDDIEPLIEALQALKADPANESCFERLVDAFDRLGPRQGAVLTYAPYVSLLLSDDPFGF